MIVEDKTHYVVMAVHPESGESMPVGSEYETREEAEAARDAMNANPSNTMRYTVSAHSACQCESGRY